MKLSEKITKLRKISGLSQEDLANKVGVSRQSVYKWEAGENYPDYEKLGAIAKLFNVSFNTLLDDEIELGEPEENIVSQNNSEIEKRMYRDTFDSKNHLDTSILADSQHGYFGVDTKINKSFYNKNKEEFISALDKKGYHKTVYFQYDVLAVLFIDYSNYTFGLFFNNVPQFICPFENLITFSFSDSGPRTSRDVSTVFGVGFGSNTTIGVGSVPTTSTHSPSSYYCSISYFDKEGKMETYKFTCSSLRMYSSHDGTIQEPEEFDLFTDALSNNTAKSLNEISTLFDGIKEIGKQIINGNIKVDPLDLKDHAEEADKANQQALSNKRAGIDDANIERDNRGKAAAIVVALISILALVLLVVYISTRK